MSKPSFKEVLDDLCCRFLLNIPHEEYESFERLFFQVEEAHWFYLDFYAARFTHLPKLSLRDFGARIFAHCPLFHEFQGITDQVFNTFQNYKYQVPVNGAIIMNKDLSKVLLVKGWKASCWNFPRGKLSYGERDIDCAVREVYEEIGFNIRPYVDESRYISLTLRNQPIKLFIATGVPEDGQFVPQTRKEISAIQWHYLDALPHTNPRNSPSVRKSNRFFRIVPFLRELTKWLSDTRAHAHPVFQGRNETLVCPRTPAAALPLPVMHSVAPHLETARKNNKKQKQQRHPKHSSRGRRGGGGQTATGAGGSAFRFNTSQILGTV